MPQEYNAEFLNQRKGLGELREDVDVEEASAVFLTVSRPVSLQNCRTAIR